MFLNGKLSVFHAYHYNQVSDHAVGLDDPVHGLGALEQQDDVTMQRGIVLQRP